MFKSHFRPKSIPIGQLQLTTYLIYYNKCKMYLTIYNFILISTIVLEQVTFVFF